MICNSLSCRKDLSLETNAVVTTCSHIFCVDCANSLFSTPQICPACETSLPDSDDAVCSLLNPPDSYKTSCLSGLSPTVILDIASRALNFYSYQTSQETAFQSLITKNAQERIAVLEAQCNNLAREATSEISLLKERVESTERELEISRRKTHDLTETHKVNAKAYNKLKAQFDQIRQRNLLPPVHQSAQNAFEAPSSQSRQQQHQAQLNRRQTGSNSFGNLEAGGPIPLSNNPSGINSAHRPRQPLQNNPLPSASRPTFTAGQSFHSNGNGQGGNFIKDSGLNQASQPRKSNSHPSRNSMQNQNQNQNSMGLGSRSGSSLGESLLLPQYAQSSGGRTTVPTSARNQPQKKTTFRPAGFAA